MTYNMGHRSKYGDTIGRLESKRGGWMDPKMGQYTVWTVKYAKGGQGNTKKVANGREPLTVNLAYLSTVPRATVLVR